MTSRISLFILSSTIFLAAFGEANTSSPHKGEGLPVKSWIQKYQTQAIRFVSTGSDYTAATPGRHPVWVNKLINDYLAYEPEETTLRPHGHCDPAKIRDSIIKFPAPASKTKTLDSIKQKCAPYLTAGPKWAALQGLKIFSMKYNIDENPFFHRTVFVLPDGQKLKAVLALKDEKRRPLVMVRAGITGNVEEAFAERFFLYQLFERGFFHVLLVENMTGADYIHFNRSLNFGGIAEAYQNIYLAQLLKSPTQPLSRVVESIHLMGLSLGGQGVLTAAWMARYQRNPRLFGSFMTFCPLVNTQATFNHLFRESWLRFPLEFWARSRFSEFETFRPDLFKGPFFGLAQRLLSATAHQYRKPPAHVLGVVEPWFVQKQNDFLGLHELSLWNPTLRDPVWIWVTKEDMVVPTSLNTARLALTHPFIIDQGNHCSFPVVWDSRLLSNILAGHVLAGSQINLAMKTITLDANPYSNWTLDDVVIREDQKAVEVTIMDGKTRRGFLVEYSELDFDLPPGKIGDHERFMLKRWFSSNLQFEPDAAGLRLLVSWPMFK